MKLDIYSSIVHFEWFWEIQELSTWSKHSYSFFASEAMSIVPPYSLNLRNVGIDQQDKFF